MPPGNPVLVKINTEGGRERERERVLAEGWEKSFSEVNKAEKEEVSGHRICISDIQLSPLQWRPSSRGEASR
jgi:hypothetical protein